MFSSLPSFVPHFLLEERVRGMSADSNLRRLAITILAPRAVLVLDIFKANTALALPSICFGQTLGVMRRVIPVAYSAKDQL